MINNNNKTMTFARQDIYWAIKDVVLNDLKNNGFETVNEYTKYLEDLYMNGRDCAKFMQTTGIDVWEALAIVREYEEDCGGQDYDLSDIQLVANTLYMVVGRNLMQSVAKDGNTESLEPINDDFIMNLKDLNCNTLCF